MAYPTKIATCCYCGSKAALTVDKGRHALACATCGAPLRDIKMLPARALPDAEPARGAISHQPQLRSFPGGAPAKPQKLRKPRKAAKRKGWFKDLAEELFDAVEDIFD